MGKTQRSAEVGRLWTHGGPHVSPLARSSAAPVRMPRTIRHLPTWAQAVWSAGNWRARGTDETDIGGYMVHLDADPGGQGAAMAERDWRRIVAERVEADRLALRAQHGPGVDG